MVSKFKQTYQDLLKVPKAKEWESMLVYKTLGTNIPTLDTSGEVKAL